MTGSTRDPSTAAAAVEDGVPCILAARSSKGNRRPARCFCCPAPHVKRGRLTAQDEKAPALGEGGRDVLARRIRIRVRSRWRPHSPRDEGMLGRWLNHARIWRVSKSVLDL